jgi:GTPase SAR1 family protein
VSGTYKAERTNPTVGAFFLTKRLTVETSTSASGGGGGSTSQTTCKILLWDTAGQAQFQKLARTYYHNASAAILTFDVSQPSSLTRLRHWLDELQLHGNNNIAPNTNSATASGATSSSAIGDTAPSHRVASTNNGDMVICIAACKCDLGPSPGLAEEAKRLAQAVGALYVETSAKDNLGVTQLFHDTVARILRQQQQQQQASTTLPLSHSLDLKSQPIPQPAVNHPHSLNGASALPPAPPPPHGSPLSSRHVAAQNHYPSSPVSPLKRLTPPFASSQTVLSSSQPNKYNPYSNKSNGVVFKDDTATGFVRTSTPETDTTSDMDFPLPPAAGLDDSIVDAPIASNAATTTAANRNASSGTPSTTAGIGSNVMCEGSMLVCGTDDKSCYIM